MNLHTVGVLAKPSQVQVEPPLFQSPYFTVGLLPKERIVVVTRSCRPFASPIEASQACTPMLLVLDNLGRDNYWLLLDSREAVGNNGAEYESWFARFRRDLVRGFPRVAVVVQTQVGTLQSRRLLEADGAETRSEVFCDVAAALGYLRDGIRHSSIPTSNKLAVSSPPR